MPTPLSPLTVIAQKLNAQPPLNGIAKVLAGVNFLANGRSPPSIVLYPMTAGYSSAHDILAAFLDVDIRVAARLWANGLDEAWDLRARLIAALWLQAQGDPENADDAAAGFYYSLVDEIWDIVPDTGRQGQELEVILDLRLSASDKTLALGRVDAESMTRTAALAVAMGTSDVTASVDATVGGYGSSGVLHIEGEQIHYSGLTATSFTGLVRGFNDTIATAHAVGAVVAVTPI